MLLAALNVKSILVFRLWLSETLKRLNFHSLALRAFTDVSIFYSSCNKAKSCPKGYEFLNIF